MRKKLTEDMAKVVGLPRAEKFVALFVERLCEGIDPEDGDTFKQADIERAFENNPIARDAFVKVLCGEQKADDKAPKGRKFKAGKTYSHAELAAFYPTESGNPDYLAAAEAMAGRDGGGRPRPWVIAPGGKYNEEKSAYYLGLYRDDEIPPATVMVDGVPVSPGLPGEEKGPKEAWLSPFAPSRFLDVEMTCPVTGASFKGYVKDQGTASEDDSAMRAMHFWYSHEGTRETPRSLRAFADEKRGKGPAEILADNPALLAEWNKTKPADRPATKASKRPFVEAVTVAPRAPALDLGAPASTKARELAAIAPPATSAPSPMDVCDAIIALGLGREVLFAGVDHGFVATLRDAPTRSSQAWQDITAIWDLTLEDGSRPLRTYLQNAVHQAGLRPEARILKAALASC